ncbi:hypothetical protein V6Z11_A09G139000 [Gossypium hirsutum]
MIVVAIVTIHNFIRKHVGRNDADFMEYEDINRAYENIIDSENAHGQESDNDDNDDDDDNDDNDDDDADFMEYEDINRAYENIIDSENAHGIESDNDDNDDDDDDGNDDGESNNSSGFVMELTRDAIASSLMNSL